MTHPGPERAAPKKRKESEEAFTLRMQHLRAEVEAAEPPAQNRAMTVEVIARIPTVSLTRLTHKERERLIRAGFTTVQRMVEKWNSEELAEAIGAHRHRIPSTIERELRDRGIAIMCSYRLNRTGRLGTLTSNHKGG